MKRPKTTKTNASGSIIVAISATDRWTALRRASGSHLDWTNSIAPIEGDTMKKTLPTIQVSVMYAFSRGPSRAITVSGRTNIGM